MAADLDADDIRGKVIVAKTLRAPGRLTATFASRPGKLSHAQTLLYEIDMLRNSANSLDRARGLERYAFLESFLLHFRNLIEFFGKPQKKGSDTLSISNPEKFWPPGHAIPSADLEKLRKEDLWEKYEGKEKPDKISRYLQHCTEQRIEEKEWDLQTMVQEIEPLIKKFQDLLPIKSRPWAEYPTSIRLLDHAGYTTMSVGAPQVMSSLDDPVHRVVVVPKSKNP